MMKPASTGQYAARADRRSGKGRRHSGKPNTQDKGVEGLGDAGPIGDVTNAYVIIRAV
jgi:hypothetical protein